MTDSDHHGDQHPDPSTLKRHYDADFQGGEAYRDTLPDTQNAAATEIRGLPVAVQQVGVSGFRLPIRLQRPDGSSLEVEGRLEGTVLLKAGVRGINMSRIIRSAYPHHERTMSLECLEDALRAVLREVQSEAGRLRIDFSYPIEQRSLRSGMSGYQYYQVGMECVVDESLRLSRSLFFDFQYSSACPGSADLADHAEATRGIYSIPHSQRSLAQLQVRVADGGSLTFEGILDYCRRALQTEGQVMVRRDDEQAFAEMNGAYTKFVEDAARLLYEQLDPEPDIADFRVTCRHLESLHAHDAIAVIVKGVPGGYAA